MSDKSPELAAIQALTSSMELMNSNIMRLAEKTDGLGQSVSRVDVRSAKGREELAKTIADGLAQNRECIHQVAEDNRKGHATLKEEIAAARRGATEDTKSLISNVEKDLDDFSNEVSGVKSRVTDLETENTKDKTRRRTIVAGSGVIGSAITLALTGKFAEAWNLITGG